MYRRKAVWKRADWEGTDLNWKRRDKDNSLSEKASAKGTGKKAAGGKVSPPHAQDDAIRWDALRQAAFRIFKRVRSEEEVRLLCLYLLLDTEDLVLINFNSRGKVTKIFRTPLCPQHARDDAGYVRAILRVVDEAADEGKLRSDRCIPGRKRAGRSSTGPRRSTGRLPFPFSTGTPTSVLTGLGISAGSRILAAPGIFSATTCR